MIAGCGESGPTETAAPMLTSPATVASIAGTMDSRTHYRLSVPSGAQRLVIATHLGTGNVDLLVRQGSSPRSAADADCSSLAHATVETCAFDDPEPDTYYITLVGRAPYSDVTLTAVVTMPGDESIIGTYVLRTLDGLPVPYTLSQSGTSKFEILSGNITIESDTRFTTTMTEQRTVNGQPQAPETSVCSGPYTLVGISIAFTETTPSVHCGSIPYSGTILRDTITITSALIPIVYSK
jgi:hypothetical protein